MLNELEELFWEQKGNEVIIHLPLDEQKFLNFRIEEKLINNLVSNIPRLYYLYIELTGKADKIYFLDVEKLKTISSTDNLLKIKIGKPLKNKEALGVSLGKYSIARSESYQDRYISETGWQKTRQYFDIVDFDEYKTKQQANSYIADKSKNTDSTTKASNQNISVGKEKPSAKLKECVKCKEIIPSTLETCPYCSTNQKVPIGLDDTDSIDISI
jgi:hypothetical protein